MRLKGRGRGFQVRKKRLIPSPLPFRTPATQAILIKKKKFNQDNCVKTIWYTGRGFCLKTVKKNGRGREVYVRIGLFPKCACAQLIPIPIRKLVDDRHLLLYAKFHIVN